jgi:hypothetical protein
LLSGPPPVSKVMFATKRVPFGMRSTGAGEGLCDGLGDDELLTAGDGDGDGKLGEGEGGTAVRRDMSRTWCQSVARWGCRAVRLEPCGSSTILSCGRPLSRAAGAARQLSCTMHGVTAAGDSLSGSTAAGDCLISEHRRSVVAVAPLPGARPQPEACLFARHLNSNVRVNIGPAASSLHREALPRFCNCSLRDCHTCRQQQQPQHAGVCDTAAQTRP